MLLSRMRFPKILAVGCLAMVGSACDSQPAPNVAARPDEAPKPNSAEVRALAPKPDTARLKFDESTQILQLYELPDPGSYWMVSLPAEPRGVPVQGDFQFAKPADPKSVTVFYTLPRGGVSNPVSLQDIVDAKKSAVH